MNLTSDGIIVEVSGFGVTGDPHEWKTVAKKDKHTKKVKDAAKDGAYRSRVFCLQTGTIAEAASDPEIIIEP